MYYKLLSITVKFDTTSKPTNRAPA